MRKLKALSPNSLATSGQTGLTWYCQRHYLGAYGSKETSVNNASFLSHLIRPAPDSDDSESEPPRGG